MKTQRDFALHGKGFFRIERGLSASYGKKFFDREGFHG